jgi:hypothetical protein
VLVFWVSRFEVGFLVRAGAGFIGDFLEEREGLGVGEGTEEWIVLGGRSVFLAGIVFPEDFGFFMDN